MNRGESAGLCVHRSAFWVRFLCSSQYSPTRLLQRRRSKEWASQLKEIDQSASDVQSLGIFGNLPGSAPWRSQRPSSISRRDAPLWRAHSTCCDSFFSQPHRPVPDSDSADSSCPALGG